MNKLVNIQITCDGNGRVVVFINGQPAGLYLCEYSLDTQLEQLLEKYLVKYQSSEFAEEKLPF